MKLELSAVVIFNGGLNESIDSPMIKANATYVQRLSILETTCLKIMKIQAVVMRPFTGERRGSN